VSDLFIGSPQIYEGKPNNGFAKGLIEKNSLVMVFVMMAPERFFEPGRISRNGAADPPLHQRKINKLNKLLIASFEAREKNEPWQSPQIQLPRLNFISFILFGERNRESQGSRGHVDGARQKCGKERDLVHSTSRSNGNAPSIPPFVPLLWIDCAAAGSAARNTAALRGQCRDAPGRARVTASFDARRRKPVEGGQDPSVR
jgi:hypothetical protein